MFSGAGLTIGFTLQGFRFTLLVLFICGLAALVSSLFIEETMKTSNTKITYSRCLS